MLRDTANSDDILTFACSVHGLRDSRSEAEWKRKGLEGEGSMVATAPAKEPRRGWLPSLNNVVGDRQENILLMISIHRSGDDPEQRTAAIVTATAPSSPPPALMPISAPRRPMSPSTGSGPSTRPSTSVASTSSAAALTVIYQSEYRSLGQQRSSAPAGSSATSWSSTPGSVSFSGGATAGGFDDYSLPATLAEEGIVHFSLPVRVSREMEGEEDGAGQFSVALWQVVNRSRRTLVGSLSSVSWRDLWSVPRDPRKFRAFCRFQSERYPSAFLVMRRLGLSAPRPLSLSPAGVANPVPGKFNPMMLYFTTLRRAVAVAPDPDDLADLANLAALRPAFSGDQDAVVTSFDGSRRGIERGTDDPDQVALSSVGRWELVVCQEMAVESKFAFKVPLQFLSPVHSAMKQAALAWRRRAREERNRQGVFDTDEEAFASGGVLVRVSVSRARGLEAIAAAAAAEAAAAVAVAAAEASTTGGSGTLGSPPPKEDNDNDQQTSDPFELYPAAPGTVSGKSASERRNFSEVPQAAPGGIEDDAGDSRAARGGGGIGRGIGLGLTGIDGKRVSTSMRMLGGRVRGMGVRAVAMAKNASQASPTMHLRLGAASVQEKILRQANFYVKVVYEPPPPSSLSTCFTSEEAFWGGGDNGFDVPAAPGPEKVVGLTNTEYGSAEPVWGTNANRNACPYNQPRVQHQVSGSTRLEVVGSPVVPDGGREEQGIEISGPRSDALAFNFYVAAKDLRNNPGGKLRLHLCQNMFSWKAGIADVPVGVVTIPLAENANRDRKDSVRRPRWRDVESYDSVGAAWSPGVEGLDGGLLTGHGSPQILVGVSIQSRRATPSQPGSPRQKPLPVNASPALPGGSGQPSDGGGGALGLGQGALGRIGVAALRLRGMGSGTVTAAATVEGVDTTAATEATDTEREEGQGLGEGWEKVEDDSDTDDEGVGVAANASMAHELVETPLDPTEEGGSISSVEKVVALADCYRWLNSIGGPSLVLDTQALMELSSTVEYPVGWMEGHWRGVANLRDKLVRVLDLYSQRLAEGDNFRSSLLKKDPFLQYIPTNLHIQIWSISDPATGKTRSYDLVTTGAPAAHTIGYSGGGLVTLQAALQSLGTKVLELKAACRECVQKGDVYKVMNLETNVARLRVSLLEYETLSARVAMRRACVVSQVVTIAATSFCTKLEMMARGTLEIGADIVSGGCVDFDDLARRWITTGFLLGFEGLLSIHGKEVGMVEDTVGALDMLADFQLQVVPANPYSPLDDLSHLRVGDDAGRGALDDVRDDCEFELEVGLEERTIKCIVGGASLARLPRALWGRPDRSGGGGGAGSAGRSGAEAGGVVRIVPVLFTQGIDIQQSMSHASSSAKEKAAFQGDINSANLARLNRYCHRVCPVSRPAANRVANPRPIYGAGVVGFGARGGGEDLLLDFGDFGEGMVGPARENNVPKSTTPNRPAEPPRRLHHRKNVSSGTWVPDWIHPALSDLDAAVRDDRVNHKNTAILLEAQVAVRRLCGGRVTFCKSGKDRTAMSVTLEEALLLAENASSSWKPPQDAHDTAPAPAAAVASGCSWRAADRNGALADANVLRAHGCRLMVAEKNIGYPLYSFNALQRQFIPELYQPPPQTIQDVITSALNRDS